MMRWTGTAGESCVAAPPEARQDYNTPPPSWGCGGLRNCVRHMDAEPRIESPPFIYVVNDVNYPQLYTVQQYIFMQA